MFYLNAYVSYLINLQMRFTKKASVWPVGMVGYLRYESPVVTDGKVSYIIPF